MSRIQAWVSAARPRTLPLSIAGILSGSSYTYLLNDMDITKSKFMTVVGLALLTTLGFQVLSNFANDYGDGIKGTDNEDRVGPARAVQSGLISDSEMKRAIIVTAIISGLTAVLLIYISLGVSAILMSLLFLLLGGAAIYAAITYTVGDSAYGYKGLGDLFVFIFFGPVSVIGMNLLITQKIDLKLFLPAITIGLLSTAVLNLNNMRDIDGDRKSGKNTMVVKMGLPNAKIYHTLLIIIGIVSLAIFLTTLLISGFLWIHVLPLAFIVPLLLHVLRVHKTTSPPLLDPELKKVALSTFGLSLTAFVLCLLDLG